MFGGSRRRAPPVQPLTRETADPNAATAATSAFMRRGSNSSLSSAAAAAALRSRPTSPTNVSEVQSKRVHRRNTSVSSTTSRDRSRTREVQRSPSVNSMIERTFRSPSPGRSPAPRTRDVPPVPSLPNSTQIAAGGSPRNGGLTVQTQPFQTASQKKKSGKQGSWFGGATSNDSASPRRADSVLYSKTPSEPRPGSVSPSINFSYPRGRMQSPSPEPRSPNGSEQTMVYDANSRRMVPQSSLMSPPQNVPDFSGKPVKKKKHEVSRSGSHLSKGTVGRTQAPVLDDLQNGPTEAESVLESVEVPKKKSKKKKKKKQQEQEQQQPDETEAREQEMDEQDIYNDEVAPEDPSRPRLVKKPSMVREEPEREEEEEREDKQSNASQAALAAVGKKPASKAPKTPESKQTTSVSRTRVQSESPARSAHFASSSTDQLVVRHEPPPRSLSPRKSALKPTTPTRGISPSDDGSEASARNLSPFPKDDSSAARKKAARVSWDDKSTMVVGESTPSQETDSPIVPSPQAVKKPWHSIVTKYTKKESVSLEDDETMSPRPALPLFGSVREKKTKEPEERPLVRPSERAWSPQPQTASDEAAPAADVGQPSDAATGAAGAQEQSSKNEANISKYREPLPPVKATFEDDGPDSKDDAGSAGASTELEKTSPTDAEAKELTTVGDDADAAVDKNAPEAAAISEEAVPTISVSHPSPRPQTDDTADSDDQFVEIPGGFPDSDATETGTDGTITPLGHSGAEDESEDSTPSTPTQLVDPPLRSGSPQMTDIEEEEEDTDRCSVYSDAYEELSDVDGDGFMSLDAILTTPTDSKASKRLFEMAMAKSKEMSQGSTEQDDGDDPTDPKRTSNDWENAKSYWRSLTSAKRRQLEQEAMEEDDDESGSETETETETEATPKANDKGKSKAANGNATKAAESPSPRANDRVYQIQPGSTWAEGGSSTAAKRASAPPKASGSDAPKLRKSMRGEEPSKPDPARVNSGTMRKSMRSGGPALAVASGGSRRRSRSAEPESSIAANTTMRKSLRSMASSGDDGGSRPSLRQAGRPKSYQPPASPDFTKGHKRTNSGDGSTSSITARAPMKPTLRRHGSDSSESSFTRARPPTSDDQGFRKSMRGSMRAAPGTPDAQQNASRFSLRSLSPTGARRNSVSSLPPGMSAGMGGGMAAGRMRGSLRSESTENLGKRTSMFGRSPKTKKPVKKAQSSSRFADSSDEDDGRPMFSSRFADSSDSDDDPMPVAKGKGFAKTMRSGKAPTSAAARAGSPDIDSDDEIVPAKRGSDAASSELRRQRSGRGSLVPVAAAPAAGADGIPPARPASSRRGSFMSILRRKKDPAGKISRDVGESAARRDTRLERTTDELNMIRSNSGSHKRGPSWPLGASGNTTEAGDGVEAPDANVVRPSTSAGPPPPTSGKSKFLRRRSTSQGMVGLGHVPPPIPDAEVPPIPEQHLKKKKFGALRKMFGIHD